MVWKKLGIGVAALAALAGTPAAAQAVKTTFVSLESGVPAVLYEPAKPGPKSAIAVFVMHANGDYLQFTPCTELSKRGYRVLCANNKTNKAEAYDEGMLDEILREAGKGVAYLRALPGVRKVVLLGHSGGGTVMTAYQMIAENGPAICQQPERLSKCPNSLAGLPRADGLLLMDANWGQAGMVLLSLDPAITDENDPKKVDPALDLFDPANGFDPKGSHYSADFVRRFQQAQGARMNRLIAAAQERVALIEAGKAAYSDDEPFTVPGGNFLGFFNKLFPQDISLMAHTRAPHPLVHKDGSVSNEIVHSVRLARGAAPPRGSYDRGALRTTVRNFLSTYAVRTTPDYGYGAGDLTGIDWGSSYAFTPANVSAIHVPLLTMGMTGSYEYMAAEKIFDRSASADRSIAFIEGASHNFAVCKDCEKTPGQYGDTVKTAFDYVDGWLAKPGRF